MKQMPNHDQALSVIVPVGPGDQAWINLVEDLRLLASDDEVVFVSGENELREIARGLADVKLNVRMITSSFGRALQFNAGVTAASHEHLWFVHADSRIDANTVAKTKAALASARMPTVFFSRLKFLQDGPLLVKLNEWCVRIRSELLKIPFGDQAFAMTRETYHLLGGFVLHAPYGEDHLLIWKAHELGIPVQSTGAVVMTSARKYSRRGWLMTTLNHVRLTLKQALPECVRIFRRRLGLFT